MKCIQRLMFRIIDDLADVKKRVETKNSASLKEIKGVLNVCLTEMSEITNRDIGRWRFLSRSKISDYEKIAYRLAHKYVKYLETDDKAEAFSELVAAGMEGIMHGLTSYTPTLDTKVSTFVFGRTKFAIQKQFNAMKRHIGRSGISINARVDDNDDDAEFSAMMAADFSVEDAVEKRLRYQALDSALSSLPPQYKHIAMLCADHSVSQVAKKLHVSIKHVNDILSILRQKITASHGAVI